MPAWRDSYGDLSGFAIIVYVSITAIVLTVAIVGIVITAQYYYNRGACSRFENNTSRQTRFVRSGFVSWQCVTPSGHGKWIPTSQIRDIR